MSGAPKTQMHFFCAEIGKIKALLLAFSVIILAGIAAIWVDQTGIIVQSEDPVVPKVVNKTGSLGQVYGAKDQGKGLEPGNNTMHLPEIVPEPGVDDRQQPEEDQEPGDDNKHRPKIVPEPGADDRQQPEEDQEPGDDNKHRPKRVPGSGVDDRHPLEEDQEPDDDGVHPLPDDVDNRDENPGHFDPDSVHGDRVSPEGGADSVDEHRDQPDGHPESVNDDEHPPKEDLEPEVDDGHPLPLVAEQDGHRDPSENDAGSVDDDRHLVDDTDSDAQKSASNWFSKHWYVIPGAILPAVLLALMIYCCRRHRSHLSHAKPYNKVDDTMLVL